VVAKGSSGGVNAAAQMRHPCPSSVSQVLVCPALSPLAVPVGRNAQAGSLVASTTKKMLRLAVPKRGHVLSTAVELYGKPIREAVAALSSSLKKKDCSSIREALFLPRGEQKGPHVDVSDANMVAWSVVSMWVVGVATKALPVAASLAEAEQWFFGLHSPHRLTSLLQDQCIKKAEMALRTRADASAYFELLPYILDHHGPGSRLSVRRNPASRAVQTRKRAEGVFYTPADVAEYMAGACLDGLSSNSLPIIFDPACGTGVFLRAALREIQRRHPEKNTFSLASECLVGADIDPWPLEATAFVLLADSWIERGEHSISPAEAWHRLRVNLACIDTLLIDPGQTSSHPDGNKNNATLALFPANGQSVAERFSFSQLFPALDHGPTVILGNPPYADIGRRYDLAKLGSVFETLAVKPYPNAEIYLPFIEQMIRLADQNVCSGALVLPLSIACNIGPQFSVTRKMISNTPGRWRFAFFDREPHALFGEDVKTRNTILLWSKAPSDKTGVLSTGPLRKWRGDSRAEMFSSLRFTPLDTDIRPGIPKIDGPCQAAALTSLSMRRSRLQQVVHDIGRFNLADTLDSNNRLVFIGPTAYNFLNVFLKPPRGVLQVGHELSEHPLHAIKCASRTDAFAVFAIFSSHLAYWWWHTHGDGFHVSRRLIAELPFGPDALTKPVLSVLSERGAALWSAIKTNPIISLNRGRTSLAYTPNGHDHIRRKIDQILVNLVGLEGDFVEELQQFTARTVAAKLHKHAITETEEKESP